MRRLSLAVLLAALLTPSCSDEGAPSDSAAVGGFTATGGSSAGGSTASGGSSASGPTATGGSSAGGSTATGGSSAGGTGGGAGSTGATGGVGPTGGSGGVGAGAGGTSGGAGSGGTDSDDYEWLPSWATTIQRTETRNLPPPLAGKTLRQFVWPTVSGTQIRIQLSNEKGATPVEVAKVNIAQAATTSNPGNSGGSIDAGTDASFSFDGQAAVTIPAGETVWSDPLTYPLAELELTAISMLFGQQVPSAITGHPGSRTTSYIANGDAVSTAALAGAETRERWYFINAIEVMAPPNAYAIAVLGDSITDGYGVLNQFARWPDFMTLAIQDDPLIADTRSVLNFGMGANSLTSSSDDQDAGVIRFERDVLRRDKVKWLIVFEGVNDINGGVQAQPIIDAYQRIIDKSHEKGILVYGSTITPNGSGGVRSTVNEWIRTSGEFDAVIDLDAVIRDPNNPNTIASMFDNDGLHPSIAGYEAMGRSVDLSLFYQLNR